MTRREIRENVFMMLFRVEFHEQTEFEEQIALFEDELASLNESDMAYIKGKCSAIFEKIDELDDFPWKINGFRMCVELRELSIIRLALYEIKYEEDIPLKVSINEAVELAKKYGTDDSPSFVNGILAKFA